MEEVLKPDEAEAAIEALLFTMGEAISAEAIGAVIGHDKATVIRLVHHLMDRYQNEKRGIRIIELDGSFQMCTSPEMYDYVIKLLEYGLITEAGRLNAPGRPILLATTEEFLRTFGVQSVEGLPSVSPEEMETLKTEAEEEVQMTLDV